MQNLNEQIQNMEAEVSLPDLAQNESVPSPAEIEPPPDEFVKLLDSNMPSLKGLLAQNPNARDDIERIIKAYVKDPPNAETGRLLLDSMQIYTGKDEGEFLLNLLTRGIEIESRNLYELFIDRLEASDRPWARMLLAVYGKKLNDIWLVSGEMGDDWRTLNWQVIYNRYADRWQIKTSILKYNGDVFFIESRLDAYINLIALLLDPLFDLPIEPIENVLDGDKLVETAEKCIKLINIISMKASRQQLAEAILKVPQVEKYRTRNHWLAGIPTAHLSRHTGDPDADIRAIVDQLDQDGVLESGKHAGESALIVLIDNILADIPEESDEANELISIREDLEEKLSQDIP